MNEENNIKKVLSLCFIIFLILGFIRNNPYEQLKRLSEYLGQEVNEADAEGTTTISSIEAEYADAMPYQRDLIELNGLILKKLRMQGYYSDIGLYITDDLYIVSASDYTSTDYEYEQILDFKEFLDENGVNLLYVNEPTKYDDDSLFLTEFGVETYSNRNMDAFMKRIKSEGINTLDLRDNIKKENLNIFDMYYRTDHHWTTHTGLWATKIIADGLNKYCGYSIDTSIYDENNYIIKEWKECWLGEQGKKVAKSYVGLDDYAEIIPSFSTSYTFKMDDGKKYEGDFNDFINEEVYNLDNDVYTNGSWHYSYEQKNCINNNVDYGKVLIIGDSYEQVTEPFISLGVHEVDSIVLRQCEQSTFDLRNEILKNGYDTVIIAYAQFMLGAHDNSESSNYRMYTFY